MSNVYNVSPETFRKEEMASLVKGDSFNRLITFAANAG